MANNARTFAFEDFTLVLTRDCNLACRYCPLDRRNLHMTEKIIQAFLPQLLRYADRDVLLTLFGGEPLINRRAIEQVLTLARAHGPSYADAGGRLWIKIVTNGTLLGRHLPELAQAARVPGLDIEINISIDGSPATQLRQRPPRRGGADYYPRLARTILAAKGLGLHLSLGMVADFSSPSLTDDFKYLCDTFELPIFLMPVDLTYAFIKSCPDIAERLREYAHKLRNLLTFLRANPAYGRRTVNLNETEFRDLKMPPLGPTIDWDGSVYTTRDFLFTMDRSSSFAPVGALTADNLDEFVRHFGSSRAELVPAQHAAMRTYFGRSMFLNKKVGDYFTRLVYGKTVPTISRFPTKR